MAALVGSSCRKSVSLLCRFPVATAVHSARNLHTLNKSVIAGVTRAVNQNHCWSSWTKTIFLCPHQLSVRNYANQSDGRPGKDQKYTRRSFKPQDVTGDHKQLWKSVLSGRGTGRRKKQKTQGVDPRLLGFGRSKVRFPVFHDTVVEEEKKQAGAPKVDRTAQYKRKPMYVPPGWTQRGYTGTNWGGRLCGSPVTAAGDVLQDFQGIVLEVRRVSAMKATGRRKRLRAIVAVGNYNGLVGLGVASGQRFVGTIEKARNKAANYLYHIDRCDGHTIYHNFDTKYKACRMILERKPTGFGLRCQRIMKTIATLAGIKDLRCKMLGSTTPITVAKGTIQAFLQQESHAELAERKGLNVVEFRKENSYRPVIVAKPSEKSAERMMKKIAQEDDGFYDFETVMDPYRGLHRPKTKFEIF